MSMASQPSEPTDPVVPAGNQGALCTVQARYAQPGRALAWVRAHPRVDMALALDLLRTAGDRSNRHGFRSIFRAAQFRCRQRKRSFIASGVLRKWMLY